MADDVRYLATADVMALHVATMRRLGSPPEALRDEGLLASTVLRPQMAAHYEDADLIRQAALLAVGIAQNQPYVDGNKRTACVAGAVFLELNCRHFSGDSVELARQLELLAERTDSLDAATFRFEAWLREHTREGRGVADSSQLGRLYARQ